jgi:hypothetical protein
LTKTPMHIHDKILYKLRWKGNFTAVIKDIYKSQHEKIMRKY